MAGPSMFFEVLKRRGAYDGYGASNSPATMAALRRDHARQALVTPAGP